MWKRLIVGVWFLLGTVQAHAWWNPDWAYRKAITLDTTPAGLDVKSPLTDVPVLVRLHTGNFSHFLDVGNGGGDIRFVAADDKTPLKYHIEKFDPVNELAYIWVRLPALKAASKDNKIWMYFGNPKATAGDDPAGTYAPADGLVYHFEEPAGTPPQDETANHNNAASSAALPNPAALIGSGVRLGAGIISINDAPSLRMAGTQGWTFATWIKIDAPQADAYLMDRVDGGQRLTLAIDQENVYARYTGPAGTPFETARTTALAPGAWHHLALVAGGGKVQIYLDGAETASVDAPLADMGGAISVGGAAEGSHLLDGNLDELSIATVARTADDIAYLAHTQGPEPKGIDYLADEKSGAAGEGEGAAENKSSYFGIILNEVFGNKQAIVEQSVIGVCLFMALIAFSVMFFKQVYLVTARKATDRFLSAYEGLGIDATTAGDAANDIFSLYGNTKAFGASPLFRVYRHGVDEIRRRLSPAVGAQSSGLEERSVVAIRAALDATMVREGQRLNAQMVLLTIAISGGPFIGLLGTVVGVMVTFAAIAATGDVNINAIAPGMAAALLATTAGLGVAIPSLFGYNYLGSRVKELSADMHVFADEFIARLNEIHGR